MTKILQKENPILRMIAGNVSVESIKSAKIQKIIKEMRTALLSQEDGVAIAAPQIGYSLRIFVVSKKVFEIVKESKEKQVGTLKKNIDITSNTKNMKDLIFINPVIQKISKEKNVVEEGCLSVRYLYGQVSRSTKATVEAYNEFGKKFTRGGTGLLAQIFQHETDHLNGILFIDKAQNVEELVPEHLKTITKNAKK